MEHDLSGKTGLHPPGRSRGHGFAIMPWRIKPWQSSLGLASISNCKKAAPPARLFVALRLFMPAITRAAE
jgi:hypothetical protein